MKIRITCLVLFLFTITFAQVTKINPIKSHPSSFAIVIDKDTFDKTKDAVLAYRDAVELDGLSSFILVNDWKNPEDVKLELQKLYKGKPKLEGAVFIGNIPIAMIRNGQHMSSAFKIDEDRYPFHRSSVASDRFYDDFDLQFKFLKQDSANTNLFYYSITPESPQRIEKDIYTARIKPSGENKTEKIKTYLFRVAEQKRNQNPINNAFVFTGHGYYSEALSAWTDERLSLREQFPQLFMPGGRIKILNHGMSREMKEILLTEVQNKDLDIALFHAHGDDDLQLISAYPIPLNTMENIESAKLFFRSKLRQAQRRKQSVEDAKAYFLKEYSVPESWFDGAFDDSVKAVDSLLEYKLDIHIADVRSISPQAKFIMFDECFNASFQLDEFIAGEYVFGNGNVIVAEGNSVNVLQDKWADEYLGLLNYGVRVGNLHKLKNLIESNIVGDPTFHFTSNSKIDLNKMLVFENENTPLWKKYLTSEEPELRSLALRKLFRLSKDKMEKDLIQFYMKDPSINVRIHSLKSLASINSKGFHDLLRVSINDPYEFIRRKSAEWMGEIGDTSYLPLLAKVVLTDESERVSFNGRSSMEFLGALSAYQCMSDQLDKMPQIVSKDKMKSSLKASFERNNVWLRDELLQNIVSDTIKLKSKLNEIRTFRNYRFIHGIPELIKLALNKAGETSVRVTTVETLGWYNFSIQKDDIIFACDKIITDSTNPQEVKEEAIRTKNRLLTGSNDVILP